MNNYNVSILKEEFILRQKKTQELIQEKGLDGIIAFSGYCEREGHVCYLTNHRIPFPNATSHIGLGYAAFLLPAEGKGILVAPLGYEPTKVIGVESAKTATNLVGELVNAIHEKKLGSSRIGIAGTDVLPIMYYSELKLMLPHSNFETVDEIMESQRSIKSPYEIELLRNAAKVADAGLEAGLREAKIGKTGADIEMAARKAAVDKGADFIVRVRVSSGKRIDLPIWPMVQNRRLEHGDFVYIDFIGWYKNYGFDSSRVTVVGKPTDAQHEYLNHMAEATDWAIKQFVPGNEVKFVEMESEGISISPFAHGIGLEITEQPWFLADMKHMIKPGMVICVEPSVRTPKFGGMSIEDAILITPNGPEVLNQCPRVQW